MRILSVVRKDEPASSDVHVDAVMGAGKKKRRKKKLPEAVVPVIKVGDIPHHNFHGNQYTGGIGGGEQQGKLRGIKVPEVDPGTRERQLVSEHLRVDRVPQATDYGEYDGGYGRFEDARDTWESTFQNCRAMRRIAAQITATPDEALDPNRHRDASDMEGFQTNRTEQELFESTVTLMRAVRDDSGGNHQLFRSSDLTDEQRKAILDGTKKGDIISLPLAAFADGDTRGQKATRRYGDDLIMTVDKGARGVTGSQLSEPVYTSWDQISPELRISEEDGGKGLKPGDKIDEADDPDNYYEWMDEDLGPHEVVTGGKFKVIDVRKQFRQYGSGPMDQIVVRLKQVGVFDPDSGALVPTKRVRKAVADQWAGDWIFDQPLTEPKPEPEKTPARNKPIGSNPPKHLPILKAGDLPGHEFHGNQWVPSAVYIHGDAGDLSGDYCMPHGTQALVAARKRGHSPTMDYHQGKGHSADIERFGEHGAEATMSVYPCKECLKQGVDSIIKRLRVFYKGDVPDHNFHGNQWTGGIGGGGEAPHGGLRSKITHVADLAAGGLLSLANPNRVIGDRVRDFKPPWATPTDRPGSSYDLGIDVLDRITGHHDEQSGPTPVKPITADEARGNSRPVTAAEFDQLASKGRDRLTAFTKDSSAPEGLDKNLPALTDQAYAEVQKSWGGVTIDAHTGKPVDSNADAYALTIKAPGQNSITLDERATPQQFASKMRVARKQFDPQLSMAQGHLGVFHDDDTGRIDIDPVLIVKTPQEVEEIGAFTHAVGGAYHFASGNGYFPPHVSEDAGPKKVRVLKVAASKMSIAQFLAQDRDPERPLHEDEKAPGKAEGVEGKVPGKHVPILKVAHDVSGESRDDHGRWSGTAEHVPLDQFSFDLHDLSNIYTLNAREDKWESPEYLDNLKADVAANGIKSPVVIRAEYSQKDPTKIVRHSVWDGNHRIVAAKELGLKTIPAVAVKSGKDAEASRYLRPSELGVTTGDHEHYMVTGKEPNKFSPSKPKTSVQRGPFHTKEEANAATDGLTGAKVQYYPPGTLSHQGGEDIGAKGDWSSIPGLKIKPSGRGPGRPGAVRAFSPEADAAHMVAGVLSWYADGEIRMVTVFPKYRRMGLGTELLRQAREVNPEVHHSDVVTDDGRAWRDVTKESIPILKVGDLPDHAFHGNQWTGGIGGGGDNTPPPRSQAITDTPPPRSAPIDQALTGQDSLSTFPSEFKPLVAKRLVALNLAQSSDPDTALREAKDMVIRNMEDAYTRGQEADEHWYQEAHDWAADIGQQNGLTTQQVAAITSSLSPLRNWEDNKEATGVLLKTLNDNKPFTITKELADDFNARRKSSGRTELKVAEPGTFKPQDTDPTILAALHPDMPVGAAGVRPVIQAIAIARGADINKMMSGPKTRSFVNNITDPNDERWTTIDTWMYRAMLGDTKMPLTLDGKKGNFTLAEFTKPRVDPDTGKTKTANTSFLTSPAAKKLGVKPGIGLYPVFVDAVKEGARLHGITPNAYQARVWSTLVRESK